MANQVRKKHIYYVLVDCDVVHKTIVFCTTGSCKRIDA